MTTTDILEHHLKCFGEGDLSGILSDYELDAVLFTPSGPLKGVGAIRALFEQIFAEFQRPGASFRMKLQSVEGDYAYVLWTAETADNVYAMATDTFIVRDGKIAAQSFAAHASPTSIESGRRHDETVARDIEVIGGATA
ncbi:MAG TPA: nuclear transport factor 2 family protein [Vicinamibacterales bacterium]|nr:nuclear transport factor 2 family protein [Vicinamibacterales bacterium]